MAPLFGSVCRLALLACISFWAAVLFSFHVVCAIWPPSTYPTRPLWQLRWGRVELGGCAFHLGLDPGHVNKQGWITEAGSLGGVGLELDPAGSCFEPPCVHLSPSLLCSSFCVFKALYPLSIKELTHYSFLVLT